MRRIVSVLASVCVVGLALFGIRAVTASGATGLTLTGVSLNGAVFESAVTVPGDWSGRVLDIGGTAADTSPPLTVTVGSAHCVTPPTLIGTAAAFRVVCVLPILPAGQSLDVTVGLAGQTATLAHAVNVPPQPSVSSVAGCASNGTGSTSQCPTSGGVDLTLTGTGFGSSDVTLVGGRVCVNLAFTATTLTCILPPGSGTEPLTIASSLGVVPTTLSVGYATPPVVPSGPPSAPTGITIRQVRGHVTLSWKAPVSTGGSALTGYTVTPYRNGMAQPTISVPAIATSVQPTLPAGTYVFEVSAKNASGAGPESAPSAPAQVAASGGSHG